MKNVLVIGSTGFVGSFICKMFQESTKFNVFGATYGTQNSNDLVLDITDKENVFSVVEKTQPDVVIDCVKIPKSIDYYDEHKEEGHNLHVTGVMNVIDAFEKFCDNPKYIYLSTDYIYNGKKGNYTEDDLPDPLNYYGQSKLDGEQVVKSIDNHLILRPTVIFGLHPEGHNFFMQMYRNQKNAIPMKVPQDQINNPTYIKVLMEIISRSIEDDLKGTYISTGPEAIDRYSFALRIADTFGFDKSLLTPITTPELRQVAKRPLNCGTVPEKLQKELNWRMPSLDDSLNDLKREVDIWEAQKK